MPTLTIFAGVNGCGKTSLYRFKKVLYSKNRINLDEIVREMGGSSDSVKDYITAANYALEKMDTFLKERKSFTWETTVIARGTLKYINKAKQLGYKINVNYVNVESLDIALKRVEQRVKKGGHNVKDDIVESRYVSQFNNIIAPLALCDNVYFYDNTKSMKIVGVFKNNIIKYADRNCEWMETICKKHQEYFSNYQNGNISK